MQRLGGNGGGQTSHQVQGSVDVGVIDLTAHKCTALSKLGKGPVFRQSGEAADFIEFRHRASK